jgi:hypothetical protein
VIMKCRNLVGFVVLLSKLEHDLLSSLHWECKPKIYKKHGLLWKCENLGVCRFVV